MFPCYNFVLNVQTTIFKTNNTWKSSLVLERMLLSTQDLAPAYIQDKLTAL